MHIFISAHQWSDGYCDSNIKPMEPWIGPHIRVPKTCKQPTCSNRSWLKGKTSLLCMPCKQAWCMTTSIMQAAKKKGAVAETWIYLQGIQAKRVTPIVNLLTGTKLLLAVCLNSPKCSWRISIDAAPLKTHWVSDWVSSELWIVTWEDLHSAGHIHII